MSSTKCRPFTQIPLNTSTSADISTQTFKNLKMNSSFIYMFYMYTQLNISFDACFDD